MTINQVFTAEIIHLQVAWGLFNFPQDSQAGPASMQASCYLVFIKLDCQQSLVQGAQADHMSSI